MRSRLFWKICLAFWFTALLVNQGSWLLFFLYWDPPPSREWIRSNELAPVQLASARNAIETGGMPAFERLRIAWPASRRDAITVVAGSDVASASDRRVERAKLPDGRAVTLVYMIRGESRREWSFWRSLERSMNYNIAAAFGGLLFAAVLAWYLTRPIQTIRRGFGSLARGDLDTRLSPAMGRRRDEIADLARDFDSMAERLEQLVAMRDQLLHDVSHELRSPLARLNLAIALMRQNPDRAATSIERIETEVRRLDELVGELLSLARLESGGEGRDSYFELNGLVESVLANARFEAKAAGISVEGDLGAGGQRADRVVRGDFELMRRALENVVRNAVKVSATGQTVRVAVVEGSSSDQVRLIVSDEGPGVPPDRIGAMFEPFVRLDPAGKGGGYGLGLAIARRAVTALGGMIEARNRPRQGLEVTITLPLYRGPIAPGED